MVRKTLLPAALILLGACSDAPNVRAINFVPDTFETEAGGTVDGELGFLVVPENHDERGGKTISLAVARFTARGESSAYPIVYLSGGPGAPGIHPERMPLFDALREFGPVYTFDQRGTGLSEPVLDCPKQAELPPSAAPTPDQLLELYRQQARECAAYWRTQGSDLARYNTRMSARDVDALRRAIGAEKLRLVATSYGTHLALAVIREFEEHIDRAVLSLIEGPDHTIKLPNSIDAHLFKVSEVIAADPVAGPLLPNLHEIVVDTIDVLDQSPMELSFEGHSGTETHVLTGFDFRRIVAGMIGRRFSIQLLVEYFAPLASGNFSPLAATLPGLRRTRESAMRAAMDCASGLSPERRFRIEEESRTSLLGTVTDFPYPDVCEAWGIEDLGEEFRSPVESPVSTLFVSGDLDGRTPISNADEVRRGFPNSAHIIVEQVGHEGFVFFAAPELIPMIGEFFSGSMPDSSRLVGLPLVFSFPNERQP